MDTAATQPLEPRVAPYSFADLNARHEARQHAIDQALNAAGLYTGPSWSMRLDTFDDLVPAARSAPGALETHPGRARVLTAVHRWLQARCADSLAAVSSATSGYGPDRGWLFLHGPYGTGKTHLALGAMREVIIHGGLYTAQVPAGLTLNWPAALEQAREAIRDKSRPEPPLARAREADVLVLDDLDKTNGTAWALERLYTLLDARIMTGRTTILTANRPYGALNRFWLDNAPRDEVRKVADRAAAITDRLTGAVAAEVDFSGLPSWRRE